MEEDLIKFRAQRGQPIEIRFPDPSHVAEIAVDDAPVAVPTDSVVVQPPANEHEISKLDLAVDPGRRAGPVEVEIHSGDRVFRHFILPDSDRARLRFVYEESEPNLIYCAKCDDYVIAGKNGKCPRNH